LLFFLACFVVSLFVDEGIRTAELKFLAGNFNEPVPRPYASGDEHMSRGRIPPRAQKRRINDTMEA
jgi:hypothetical protein